MVTSGSSVAVSDEISVHPPQRFLFGPGPTQVHPRVYEAMAQQVVGHLDPYFFQVASDNERMLRTVFGTKNQLTFAISGTGSGGMETAITNFVDAGTKVAVLANGYFCDRMTEMAKRQGANVVRLEKPWGEFFTEDEGCRVHPPRKAAGRDVRYGRDFHRRLRTRRSHLQSRA